MVWPPRVGKLLPRAAEPLGIRYKLSTYSLNTAHIDGGPKARGFALILGITIDAISHLEAEIRAGITQVPVSSVRENPPHGVNCVVEVLVRGLGHLEGNVIPVRTVWRLADPASRPRLVSAFPKI